MRPGLRIGRFSGGRLRSGDRLTQVGVQHHVVNVPGRAEGPAAWITRHLERTVILAASCAFDWRRVRDVDPERAARLTSLEYVGDGSVDLLRRALSVARWNGPAPDDVEAVYRRFAGVEPTPPAADAGEPGACGTREAQRGPE